jgi:hypothetical protein
VTSDDRITHTEYHLGGDSADQDRHEARREETVDCEWYEPCHALQRGRAAEVVGELDVVCAGDLILAVDMQYFSARTEYKNAKGHERQKRARHHGEECGRLPNAEWQNGGLGAFDFPWGEKKERYNA